MTIIQQQNREQLQKLHLQITFYFLEKLNFELKDPHSWSCKRSIEKLLFSWNLNI